MTTLDRLVESPPETTNALAIVKNAASGHFSAVDLDRRTVVADLGNGRYPHTARYSPDGRYAYLLYIASAHLEVVDLDVMQTVTRIEQLGTAPVGSAMTADGEWLFVGTAVDLPDDDNPGVMAFNITDDTVPTRAGSRELSRCAGMTVGPDGRLYVARKQEGDVAAVTADAALDEVGRYGVGDQPHDLYSVPATSYLAVNNAAEASTSFIDTEAGTITSARTGENPHGIAFAPADGGYRAVVPAREGTEVAVVSIDAVTSGDDDPTEALIDIGTASGFAATTPDGRYAVVDSYETPEVTILDLAAQAVVNRITVGGEPLHVRFAGDASECYIGNMETQVVTVLNTAALLDGRPQDVTVAGRITGLGEKPSGIFPREVAG